LTKNRKSEKKKMLIFFSICCVCYALFYIIFPISKLDSFDNIFTLNIGNSKDSDIELPTNDEKDSYEDYIEDAL
jgi:hypothetical protein